MSRMIRDALAASVLAAVIGTAYTASAEVPVPAPNPARVVEASLSPAPICTDAGALIETLRGRYREHVVAHGTTERGNTLTLWVGPDGSFTVVVSRGEQACMVDAGHGFEVVAPRGKGGA